MFAYVGIRILHGSLPFLMKFKLGWFSGVRDGFGVKLEITIDQLLRH